MKRRVTAGLAAAILAASVIAPAAQAVEPGSTSTAEAMAASPAAIDTLTGRQTFALAGVSAPTLNHSLLASPDGRYAYVGTSTAVTRVDVNSGTRETLYSGAGISDIGLSPNGEHLYVIVINDDGGYIQTRVVDVATATGAVVYVWNLGATHFTEMSIASDGVVVINGSAITSTSTSSSGATHVSRGGVDYLVPSTRGPWWPRTDDTPDRAFSYGWPNLHFATGGTVFVQHRNAQSPPVALTSGSRILAVSPGGTWLYVAQQSDGSPRIAKVDASTGAPAWAVAVNGMPHDLAVSSDGQIAYMATNTPTGPSVVALNAQTGQQRASASLSGVGAAIDGRIAVSPTNGDVYYVAPTADPILSVFRLGQLSAPATVAGVQAAERGDGSVQLWWSASEGADSYEVIGQRPDGSQEQIAVTSGTEQSVTSDQRIGYRNLGVVARNAAGASAPTWISLPEVVVDTHPGAIEDLAARQNSDGSFSLSWRAAARADDYVVFQDGFYGEEIDRGSTTGTSLTIPAGGQRGEPRFSVAARNSTAIGAYSRVTATVEDYRGQ